MTPAELSDVIVRAVRAAVDAGELAVEIPEHVVVERTRNRDHGDYATNIAMRLAKPAGRAPREVAETLVRHLLDPAVGGPGLAGAEVAGPGFINLRLAGDAQGRLARVVVEAGSDYGRSDVLAGQQVNVEFVSANPTGPIHIGGVRWAAVGDALARLLDAAGAKAAREYYVNDAGVQIDRFAQSLLAALRDRPAPEDGYQGEYVGDVARAVAAADPDVLTLDDEAAVARLAETGTAAMLAEIEASLRAFGVEFDVWLSEKSLHASGAVDQALATLREQGHVYEADDAVWLRTTDFGDDKDRVLVKSDGTPTYFASDAAYYLDKRSRGFDRCIYLLGADHHGYVGRLRALAACAGDDPAKTLVVLIGQLVSLVKNGEPVRMSKRAGNVVTLEDMLEAVGADAGRYMLARASADSAIELDIDLLTRRDSENPVFYVQYAHARVSSLLRNAAEVGVGRGADFDPGLLVDEREGDLLRDLAEFPRVVAAAAELLEPHRVARYLEALAGTYHRFYDGCRVLPQGGVEQTEDEQALTQSRLWLVEATRTVLANGLALLGVSAPERM